jgi:Glutathione S-transferase N-terminal domain
MFTKWGKRQPSSAGLLPNLAVPDLDHQTLVRVAVGPGQPPPTLTQFRPAWTEQAYLRFAGVPYALENSRFADSAVTGPYPQFRDGSFCLPAAEVLGHLACYRRDLDHTLGAEERADSVAFAALVREQLAPLLLAVSDGVG